ncbi:MAG TPA: hypothetical protein VK213_00610 [Bacteroidales bacterium]|nr:hypothetical protein [Bacteroidales bacterium]
MITKTDSITISRIEGMERSNIALPSLPSVKSCSDPEIASLTSSKN